MTQLVARGVGIQFEDELTMPPAPHYVKDVYRAHGLSTSRPASAPQQPAVGRSGTRKAPRSPEATQEAAERAAGSAWDDATRLTIEAAGFEVVEAEPDDEMASDEEVETDPTALAAWVNYANQVMQ